MKLKLNIGISSAGQSADPVEDELAKAELAVRENIDYLSHISIFGRSIPELWRRLSRIDMGRTKLCGVPLYESCLFGESPIVTCRRYVEEYGVKALTLHMTDMDLFRRALAAGFRVNSRGGMFLAESGSDVNPLERDFDNILDLCVRDGIEVFIGTSLRPGTVEYSRDINRFVRLELEDSLRWKAKVAETGLSCELECMGHVSQAALPAYRQLLGDTPICSMGPLISDAVNGYDDLNAIFGCGLALDAGLNVSTSCVVTRSEHIRIPTLDDDLDAIRKYRVFDHLRGVAEGKAIRLAVESRIASVKGRLNTQCSAYVNMFGEMDVPEKCDICGDHCPLEMKKKGLA